MRLPRMTLWLVVSIALALLVYLTMPVDPAPSRWARFLVVLHKLNLVALAGWIGYWLDRGVFPYARPDRVTDRYPLNTLTNGERARSMCWWMLRRAIIIAACMIAVGLGV